MAELIVSFFVEVIFEVLLLAPGIVIHKLVSREHRTYKQILNSSSSEVLYSIYGYCATFWIVFIGMVVGVCFLMR